MHLLFSVAPITPIHVYPISTKELINQSNTNEHKQLIE